MRFLNDIKQRFRDPSVDLRVRLFVLLTMVSELAVAVVFLCDILLNENMVETGVLAFVLVVNPFITWLSVKNNDLKRGGLIISATVVFLVMPVVFFFGGGVDGGATIWFVYAYFYVGLLLTGRIRTVMLTLLLISAVAEHLLAWFCPWLVIPHSRFMCIIDTLASVVVVGIGLYVLVVFQNSIYLDENARAREEAEKVERMNRAQNRFFSNMSHEIRTPINTILGLNEMIMREAVSKEVVEDAANIQSAGKMLLGLINDILDMSKFESGGMTLTPVAYSPRDMLSDIAGMLWMRARDKGLEFSVDLAPDVPALLTGDEVRIKQVLINLVTNAIKYTNEGSVSLSIQCERKENDDVMIIYTVSDTGMGIKKENIPYLFDAFKRVDEEKNRYIEGTGLGLSIVKNFVDLMKGRITVNSVYTKGSTFILEIPQKSASDETVGRVQISGRPDIGERKNYASSFEAPQARVLVVDDNETNLMVVKKLLRGTGVKIDTAQSGSQALELTLGHAYDVIFMDHLMPQMDGIECAAAVRNQIGGLSINASIVALTANAGPENEKLYRENGFDGYLVKPVTGEALERELYRLLPGELVTVTGEVPDLIRESTSWMTSGKTKKPVIITTESQVIVPADIADEFDVRVIPYKICTKEGVFRDGYDIDGREVIAYMEATDYNIETKAPSPEEYESFFADALTSANNVIHFTMSDHISKSGKAYALEAAASFENVKVVDTGFLSGGEGHIVSEVCRMVKRGTQIGDILDEAEALKKRVVNGFITQSMDYMARSGQVSAGRAGLSRAFMAHPVFLVKNGEIKLKRVFFGEQESSFEKFINYMLRDKNRINKEFIRISHVGLTTATLNEIRSMIEKRVHFEKIYFDLIPASVAAYSGPGALGLTFETEEED